VHAAGVVHLTPVADLTDPEFDEMLDPKTRGTWALHQALSNEDLDFFVLFSSVSSLFGSPLLAGYAAGNAFLDALVHYRRQSGLPATCINWGFWSSVGMAARLERDHGQSLVPQGIHEFTPEEGADVFEALLTDNTAQAMVMPIDWARWSATHSEAAASPLLRELLESAVHNHLPTTADRDDTAPPASIVKTRPTDESRLIQTAARPVLYAPVTTTEPAPSIPIREERTTLSNSTAISVDANESVEDYLLEQVAKVTGLPCGRLNRRLPLKKQGLDSLMAMEVRNRIQGHLGVSLSPVVLLGGSTLTEVAEELTTLLSKGAG
jgi:hypothetical protein